MSNWDPDTYLAFADLRSRPGLELIGRIHISPATVVDLGCGTGELTAVLARRWPNARVVGIDSSRPMLEQARARFPPSTWPNLMWQELSIESWRPAAGVDLILSNAALHWLGDHRSLFPALMSRLASQGVMAVQMPDNWDAPTHRTIGDLVDDPRWRDRAAPVFVRHPVATIEQYRAWLAPHSATIDSWRTTYHQVLEGVDPILNWVRGSVLAPVLAVLDSGEREQFESELVAAYATAYPPGPDGKTVLPFSRIFIVATKP